MLASVSLRRVTHAKRQVFSSSSLAKTLSSVRFQSDASEAVTCPITGSVSSTKSSNPQLRHVKAFPFVGSIIPQLSGIPNTMTSDPYAFWSEMREIYGDFYTMGIPGTGSSKDSRGIKSE